jgi:Domain of unknown function (DUF4350)
MRTNHLTAWCLLIVLFGSLAGVAYYVLQVRVAAGQGMPAYSVYSEERNGLGDAARLLRQLGWEPVAVTRPIQFYPGGTRPRLLVLVEPQASALTGDAGISDGDAQALLSWVEQGNTLLLVGRQPTAVHLKLGITLRSDAPPDDETTREVTLGEAGGYTDDIDRLVVEGADRLQAAQSLPLWSLDGRPNAALLPKKKGRIIVVADPSLLTRRGLRRQDNVMFLYNVVALTARDGRVYFDEYHHGLHSGGGFWGYLRFKGLLWIIVPVLAAMAAAGWALAIRLGPAVPKPTALGADAVAYASALARIYERAGVRQRLGRSLARDFVTALARHLRMRRSALPAEILAAWRQRQPAEARHVQELLRGASEVRQANISERRLLAWNQAFDAFTREQLATPKK